MNRFLTCVASYFGFLSFHHALAPNLPISDSLSGGTCSALALPPLMPPFRPKATA
jgi:hypothetical protein